MNSIIYDLNILKNIFKNGYYKVILVLLILLASLLAILFNSGNEINIYVFRFALGLLADTYFIGFLWFIFQILANIYFSYLFLFYEIDNSPEFIFLRTDFGHFMIKKYIILEIIIVLVRVLFYFFLKILFFKNVPFNLSTFIFNIGLHFLISFLVFMGFIILRLGRKIS